MFTLRPLTIVLPSREDKNHPVIDLDLHLPLLCFKSRELLQVKYKCWWLNMETTKIEGFSLLVVWVNRRSENPNQSNLDKKKCKRLFLNGCTFWLNKSVTENFGPHHIGKMFYVSVLCLQIIASILTEQRMVFFSSDWAKLTLIIECFMLYIWPLHWQHPLVPILSQHMLDFVMAPTAFLMGCHISHYEDVAKVKPK